MSDHDHLEILRATNVALQRVLRECPWPDVTYVAVATEVAAQVLLRRD